MFQNLLHGDPLVIASPDIDGMFSIGLLNDARKADGREPLRIAGLYDGDLLMVADAADFRTDPSRYVAVDCDLYKCGSIGQHLTHANPGGVVRINPNVARRTTRIHDKYPFSTSLLIERMLRPDTSIPINRLATLLIADSGDKSCGAFVRNTKEWGAWLGIDRKEIEAAVERASELRAHVGFPSDDPRRGPRLTRGVSTSQALKGLFKEIGEAAKRLAAEAGFETPRPSWNLSWQPVQFHMHRLTLRGVDLPLSEDGASLQIALPDPLRPGRHVEGIAAIVSDAHVLRNLWSVTLDAAHAVDAKMVSGVQMGPAAETRGPGVLVDIGQEPPTDLWRRTPDAR